MVDKGRHDPQRVRGNIPAPMLHIDMAKPCGQCVDRLGHILENTTSTRAFEHCHGAWPNAGMARGRMQAWRVAEYMHVCRSQFARPTMSGCSRMGRSYIVMADIVMAYIGLAYIGLAYILVVYTDMSYIVLACTVMAYIVMPYRLWPTCSWPTYSWPI